MSKRIRDKDEDQDGDVLKSAIDKKDGAQWRGSALHKYIGTEAWRAEMDECKKIEQEFCQIIRNNIFHDPGLFDVKIFPDNSTIMWGLWAVAYSEAEERYQMAGTCPEMDSHIEWFLLFDACSRSLVRNYTGNVEIQVLVHDAIYDDRTHIGRGVSASYTLGLMTMRKRTRFDEPMESAIYGTISPERAQENYGSICLMAISMILNMATPLIGNVPLYPNGCRFAIDQLKI
jgi:hypothetical protein